MGQTAKWTCDVCAAAVEFDDVIPKGWDVFQVKSSHSVLLLKLVVCARCNNSESYNAREPALTQKAVLWLKRVGIIRDAQ